VCGCTEADCRQCVEKTGSPCSWVEADLCSECVSAEEIEQTGKPTAKGEKAPALDPVGQVAGIEQVRGENEFGGIPEGESLDVHGFTAEQLHDTGLLCSINPKVKAAPFIALNGKRFTLTSATYGSYDRYRSWNALPLYTPEEFDARFPEETPTDVAKGSGKNLYFGLKVFTGKGTKAARWVVGPASEERVLIWVNPTPKLPQLIDFPEPKLDGPIVCKPLSNLPLSDVDGLGQADLKRLSESGVETLGDVEKLIERLAPDVRPDRVRGQIEEALVQFVMNLPISDTSRVANRIADHLEVKPVKAKKKAAAAK
jgi:hypothetical protein